jgi:hypothetical protein
MFDSIKRFFAHWHRIPRHKVPRWIRGKLYKQRYVTDRDREYKVEIIKKSKSIWKYPEMQGHIPIKDHGKVEYIQSWKKVKYYYRWIK